MPNPIFVGIITFFGCLTVLNADGKITPQKPIPPIFYHINDSANVIQKEAHVKLPILARPLMQTKRTPKVTGPHHSKKDGAE